MAERIYNLSPVQNVLELRRKKRAEFVIKEMQIAAGSRVLDIGCGPNGRSFSDYLPDGVSLTGVDIIDEDNIRYDYPDFKYIKRDARDLSIFKDSEFDVVVSFGMMEHICDQESLEDMAREIARVGRKWAIVVPWRYAVIEPHFKFPFFQLYPYQTKLFFVRKLNLHGLGARLAEDASHIEKNYQWFSSEKWKSIFRADRVSVSPFLDTITIIGGVGK